MIRKLHDHRSAEAFDPAIVPVVGETLATMTERVCISIRGLTVSYGHRPVLRSVSLDIPSGQLIGIVGPNGAGKSTLLKAMLGLIEPDSGSIEIDGCPIDRCRERIAYVPQTEAVDW